MGKASAELLAAAGAAVVILDKTDGDAKAVADDIIGVGGRAVPLVADVLNPAAASEAIQEAARLLGGGLDILINIVGAPSWGSALEMSVETWDSEQVRNLRYVFTTAQTFARLPAGSDSPRAIVSITSISGLNSAAKHAAYGAAKAGLMSLTRTLAQEWGPLGIRVNSVAPGVIRTDRPSDLDSLVKEVAPLRRRGEVTEIGKAVLFLASDLASYVTGQTLVVDGGLQTNFPFALASVR
jgi:NAD(P)-dependent dehydrogenase (short-subunit alcohol dehydrogenase family)